MTTLPDLGILILFAAVAGVLAIRFKQPAVIGLLAIGAIVGPNFLGIVRESETINLFAEVGAVLLLFTIGIEFNVSKLSKLGMRVFLIALFKLGIVFLLSYWLGALMGFSPLLSLYIGAILSISSTALVVRVLEQKDMINRKEVPILVASLIVEDLFAIFALTVFSSLNAGERIASIDLLTSIAVALAILSIAYVVVLRGLRRIFDWLVKYQAGETMVLTALSLGVGLSYLAESVNLSPSIGAFLAGSIVASLPRGEELEKAISPFALVFSSLFFMSIGMLINIGSLSGYWELILVVSVANVLFKFIGMGTSAYLFGFSSRSAVFSGLAMLSVGEFSILIAQEGTRAFSGIIDIVGVTSVIVFISSIATSVLVGRHEAIHALTSAVIPNSLKERGRKFSGTMGEITESFEVGSRFSAALRRTSLAIVDNAGTVGIVLGLVAGGWYFLSNYTIEIFGIVIGAFGILAIGASFAILFLAYKILKNVFIEYNLLRLSLSKHRHDLTASHIASDFAKLLFVLALFIISPFVFSIVEVPSALSRIFIVFIFLILVWRFLDLIGFEKEKPENRNRLFFKE
ncbi:MAG: cation:proton antiporter [Candidatus Micrarchaeota archaeon]